MNLPPHEDDIMFVRGPFDNQKLRVPMIARRRDAAMPFGDKLAVYSPAIIKGVPVYQFVKLCDKEF